MCFPKLIQSCCDGLDIVGRTEYFKSIESGHLALSRNDVARETVGLAEIRVSCCYDAPNERPVVLIVEKRDHLLRDCSPIGSASVCRQDQNVRVIDPHMLLPCVNRDAMSGFPQPLDEPVRVT